MEILLSYVSIWAPSLVAIAGIVFSILKAKATLTELKSSEELKDIRTQLTAVIKQNQELVKCNKMLIDKITKIQGYSDLEVH